MCQCSRQLSLYGFSYHWHTDASIFSVTQVDVCWMVLLALSLSHSQPMGKAVSLGGKSPWEFTRHFPASWHSQLAAQHPIPLRKHPRTARLISQPQICKHIDTEKVFEKDTFLINTLSLWNYTTQTTIPAQCLSSRLTSFLKNIDCSFPPTPPPSTKQPAKWDTHDSLELQTSKVNRLWHSQ